LQRFIDAGPASLKEHRERQFGDTAGLRFTQQGIAQIEQGIGTAFKTGIELLTKAFQCVKVHPSNAPLFMIGKHYSFGQAFAKSLALELTLV
jgi:hypothetical protein